MFLSFSVGSSFVILSFFCLVILPHYKLMFIFAIFSEILHHHENGRYFILLDSKHAYLFNEGIWPKGLLIVTDRCFLYVFFF